MSNEFLITKNPNSKKKIINWLANKKIYCSDMNIENLIDIVSACKTNLNECVSYCFSLNKEQKANNLYSSLIKAKNIKIDKLVDLYNESNTYNKINFVNDTIIFDRIMYLKKIQIEMDNFNYEYPIEYKLEVYSYDGLKTEYNIIPYNYQGIYTEYFPKDKTESLFKISNKNNIYIYSCSYTDKGFILGSELNLSYNSEYGFSNGKLILDREKIPYEELFVKYQPNENSFEFDIDKKVKKIKIIAVNDKMNADSKVKKRLVMI